MQSFAMEVVRSGAAALAKESVIMTLSSLSPSRSDLSSDEKKKDRKKRGLQCKPRRS